MSDLIVGPLRGLAVARRAHRNDHRDRGDQSTRGHCVQLMSVPGVGPLISTAVVAAIGTGEAFDRGRDFGAWLGAGAAVQYRRAIDPGRYLQEGQPIPQNPLHPSCQGAADATAELAKVQLRPVAHQCRAAYAPQQAGHRPCQQTRSDRLERSEQRKAFDTHLQLEAI